MVTSTEADRDVRRKALELLRGQVAQPAAVKSKNQQSKADEDTKSTQQNVQHRIELPVLYAALKRIKDIGVEDNKDKDSDLSDDDRQLIKDASLAVPYMMYKRFYEHLLLPRTMGGVAFSDAKAKQIARDIFLAMGPACCKENISEQELLNACTSVKRTDVRKILPSLKTVGKEARSKLTEVAAQLNAKSDQKETNKCEDGDMNMDSGEEKASNDNDGREGESGDEESKEEGGDDDEDEKDGEEDIDKGDDDD